MKKFAVIGLGSFGLRIVENTVRRGAEVLAIDKDPVRVELADNHGAIARELNCRDEEALTESGIDDVNVAIVGIGDSELDSIYATLSLKKRGVKKILARANNPEHAEVLGMIIGEKENVIFPAEDMGDRVANALFYPGILKYFELAPGYELVEVQVTKQKFIGKQVGKLNLEKEFNIRVIFVRPIIAKDEKDGEEKEIEFGKPIEWFQLLAYTLKKGDLLAVTGNREEIEVFEKQVTEEKK